MALPTAEQIRTLIPALSGTTEDAALDVLIARADSVLAAWCGFQPVTAGTAPTLESATYTEFLDGPIPTNPEILRLGVRPVSSVTSLHDDIGHDFSYDAADLVDPSDYVLDGIQGLIYSNPAGNHGAFSTGARVIRCIYVAGYNTGAHPTITTAFAMLVAHWWNQRHSIGLDTLTEAGATEAFADRMIPEAVAELMWPYRLPEWGSG